MTPTLEQSNAALRQAVRERMDATPADDPKMQGYDSDTLKAARDFVARREEHRRMLAEQDAKDEHAENYSEWRPPAYATEAKPTASKAWLEAVNELRALHYLKTSQYGDEDPFANVTASAKCGVEPWRRALCDLSDCVVRMQRYANGQPVDYENALMDAANWALICLVKLREVAQ